LRNRHALGVATAMAIAVGCSNGQEQAVPDLAARGEHYYKNVCIACHNGDPTNDGTLGPAIAGSSRALLEAKVLRGEYPAGYTPKRNTGQMPRLEYLEPEIDAIAAYLAAANTDG